MSATVLVIGSNSFSGSHFVKYCLDQGASVLAVSRSPETDPVFLPYRWNGSPDVRFEQIDLNHDMPRLQSLLQEFRPAYAVNFAAQGMVAQSWEAPADWYRTNLLSMVELHEQLRRCDFLEKFVQASTPEVYGHTPTWVKEDWPVSPSTPYAISKAACDFNALAYQKTYGFPVAFTRSANVAGPGQQMYRILPRALFCALQGQRMRLDGGGLSQRCFIHIEDVCAATWAVLTRAEPGSIYHLSTSELVTIRGLVERVAEVTGVPFEQFVDLGPPRPGQDFAYLLDSSRAHEELGWKPRHSLLAIIEDTARWVHDNAATLARQPQCYQHKP